MATLSGILSGAVVCFGAMAAAGPVGAGDAATSLPPRAATSSSVRAAISPSARAARTISLNETGQLHLVSKHGFTLNEQGKASGTIKGTISVRLKIVSTSRVTAEVSINPNSGSISGNGTASYHKGQTDASFSGSLSINRGTGSYGHARGSGLSFSGTIARSNDAITVHVSGRLSD
jgi:hypothetical protein